MNAFCPLSIVPVRSTPSDAAEMVNQLLFGEQIVILEDKNNWVFIESVLDKYTSKSFRTPFNTQLYCA